MTELLEYDVLLFELINGQWHATWLDDLMPLWRSKYFWFPAYLFLLVFMIQNFGRKSSFFLLAMIATIGVSDMVSSHLIKKNVKRQRPCQHEKLKEQVYLLVPCGGGYSFTSSHATNHFAIASFLMMTLGQCFRFLRWPLLLWATTIAYGQVYVGVHYPLDVIAGAFLGGVIGRLGARLLKNIGGLDFLFVPSFQTPKQITS